MHGKLLLVVIAAVGTTAATVSLPKSWPARERDAAEAVTPNSLAAHVRYLADDLLEGRAPASRGSELAMKYIAAEYERLGLQPAGDQGGWLQKFDIVSLKSDLSAPPTFRAARGGAPLVLHPPTDGIVATGTQQEA